MFGKRNPARSVGATDTFIGEGTVIEGKMMSTASLRIEGTVIGDIECAGDVTIGEKGSVRSIIDARHVVAAGRVEGSIRAKGKLTITHRGRVEGDIRAAALHVSEGGLFRGACMMDVPKTETPKAEAPRTETPRTEAPRTEAPKGAELRPAKDKQAARDAKDGRSSASA